MMMGGGGTPELGWSGYRWLAALVLLAVVVQIAQAALGWAIVAGAGAAMAVACLAIAIGGRSLGRPRGRTSSWLLLAILLAAFVVWEVLVAR